MAQKEDDAFPLMTYIDELVEELREDVPKAIKHWEEGAIHKSRVATRRLKAALDLLDPVLSDEHVKPFAKVLKKLRRRLGPLRDLDVMIGHLQDLKLKSHESAIKWLKERLEQQRDSVRKESAEHSTPARVLSRLGTWWGLREEVAEAREAADSLLANSLHVQLDAFAGQADRLAAREHHRGEDRQDPHAVRIAGKSFRYTLEMAAVQGHKLPAGVHGSFKRLQESLGMWHDYVVLTERAMQVSLEELLPHHDADLQARVLDLARLLLRRSAHHLNQFCTQWLKSGEDIARAIRETFPLAQAANESKTDRDPPHSSEAPSPAAPSPAALSNA